MQFQDPFPQDTVASAEGTITSLIINFNSRLRLYLNGVATNTVYVDGLPITPLDTVHKGDVIEFRPDD